uniref:Uncharacterized protein n=1 Tax=Fagus sylvatica TaxID=28930 RepID=A0A2N9G6I9_FAGSY
MAEEQEQGSDGEAQCNERGDCKDGNSGDECSHNRAGFRGFLATCLPVIHQVLVALCEDFFRGVAPTVELMTERQELAKASAFVASLPDAMHCSPSYPFMK